MAWLGCSVCLAGAAEGGAGGASAPLDAFCSPRESSVVIDTRAHRLRACEGGLAVMNFAVALGRGGTGKRQAGDGKTPLGSYSLGAPRSSRRFGKFIPINYPTDAQRAQGFTGSDVGIHGPARLFR